MTFINFGASEGDTIGSQRAIPGGGEQSTRVALAEAVRAFAAHADGARGTGDAARARENLDKAELALGRPAVVTRFRTLHRPVWSTGRIL